MRAPHTIRARSDGQRRARHARDATEARAFSFSSIFNGIEALAKPFIAEIPLVGGYIDSRILMSPTPAQAQTTAAVAAVLPPPPAALTPTQAITAVSLAQQAKTHQTLYIGLGVAAAVLLVVLVYMATRKK